MRWDLKVYLRAELSLYFSGQIQLQVVIDLEADLISRCLVLAQPLQRARLMNRFPLRLKLQAGAGRGTPPVSLLFAALFLFPTEVCLA